MPKKIEHGWLSKAFCSRNGLKMAVFEVRVVISAGLADSRIVENLFHLLEKYRRLTKELRSMLVSLIYSILKEGDSL